MTRVLTMVLAALLLFVASAVELPEEARLTLVSETGVVLGIGEVEEGNLTLTLQSGAEGFVTLLVEGVDGTVVSLEAMVTATGQVLVIGDGGFEDLAATIEAAGGEVVLAFEERIAQGVADISTLPEEAQEGMAGAAGNYEEAMENAAEGRAHADAAGEAGTDGEDGADAEAGAETGAEYSDDGAEAGAEVDVDVEVGGDDERRGEGAR